MDLLIDNGTDGPRTHALIVGVGYYRHLENGADPKESLKRMGIGQLTSPVYSAKAFTDWVIGEMENLDAPLGTVAILLSPEQTYENTNHNINENVAAASFANIEQAFDGWRKRCDLDENNVGIFYFAGHGAGNYPLMLLPEDFGEDESFLLKNVVNYDRTQDAMITTCKANTLCFIADACRPFNFQVLASSSPGKILAPEDQSKPESPNAPRFYATAKNDNAYGQTNDVSYYTQALLEALRGLGSWKKYNRWEVTTGRLQNGIEEAIKHISRPPGVPKQEVRQTGNAGNGLLTIIEQPFKVPVEIHVAPEVADRAAPDLYVKSPDLAKVFEQRSSGSGPWQVKLVVGNHMGVVEFPHGEYPLTHHSTQVAPSLLYHYWDVENQDA